MSRSRVFFLLLILISSLCVSAQATKDSEAVSVLSRVLTAADGASTLGAAHDFTASGNITYYWAGQKVQGTATIYGAVPDQFRLDANLPGGTQSWAVHDGIGTLKTADGTKTAIPYHNAINLGSLTLPYPRLLEALRDPAVGISYTSVATEGRSFYQVRLQHANSRGKGTDTLGRLRDADIFVDPATFTIVSIQDETHPKETMTRSYPHALYFSDYRSVSGILVPFTIVEVINGQRTWSLQLSSISFNAGLTDSTFHF